jgi:Tfp pilus assembly protein PilV
MGAMMIVNTARRSQSGITIIETMFAAFILVVGSLSLVGLIVRSIALNNRNKLDSTQMMLATSIAEQINSTIIGSGKSNLVDCAGTNHTIDTNPDATADHGASLSGEEIDFTENIAADATKNEFHMDYLLRTPCTSSGKLQGLFDVRWNVKKIEKPPPDGGETRTFLLTIGARLKGHGEGNLFFAKPATVRVMSGN